MKKIALLAALAIPMSGCAGLGALMAPPAPAPLARTTVDDRALETAWKAFDLALDAINALGDAGVIVPGSPRGRQVATAIRTVNRSLAAAERFAAAGSAADYANALSEATAGMNELRTAIRGQ